MLVSKTIETPEGTVKFEGELSKEETDMVVGVGLNYLLQMGYLPFKVAPNDGSLDMEVHTEQ